MVEWRKLGEFAAVQKTKNRQHITENAYSITQGGLIPTKNFFKDKTNVTSSDTSGYFGAPVFFRGSLTAWRMGLTENLVNAEQEVRQVYHSLQFCSEQLYL